MNPCEFVPLIARVEPLTRTRAVRGPFDYRLRPEQAEVEVGSLLRVPFGGRPALGVVVELASDSELEPDRLAEPEAVLAAGVPPDLVALAEWMAAEYCSTPARALALVLAPGATTGQRRKRALVAELTGAGQLAIQGTLAVSRAAVSSLRASGPRSSNSSAGARPSPRSSAPGCSSGSRRGDSSRSSCGR